MYNHFFEDGAIHMSPNQDLVVDSPQVIHETRFEGTTVFLHQIKGSCDDNPADQVFDVADATYEIDVLENGNLQLVAIEDPCATRSSFLPAEWAPVP